MLQQFSIDECFIDMSLRCTPENAVEVATQLKDEVKARLGFTVNVGIGSNKLLAKMASDFEKPDKVNAKVDMSRRQTLYTLYGLSFREYLELEDIFHCDALSLEHVGVMETTFYR